MPDFNGFMSTKYPENSSVTVTGGAGFIGSNLVDALLAHGNRVTVLDNFSTGKRENLFQAEKNPAFRLIEGDIRNIDDCRQAVEGADYVLHEAALGSVPRSIKDPATSTAVNVSGFVNMLFAAVGAKVKRFVYAASSSTYGDCREIPMKEEKIGAPLSPYAVTKYVNELFAENFHRIYGIDCIGLRYFNVFGRRQDPDGAYAAVIPKFAAAMLRGQQPVINGDGSISRDFTYIENVISANMLALTTGNPDALNQVYNVACGSETSLNMLFEVLREKLAEYSPAVNAVEAVYAPARPGDISRSLADISKGKKLLGYDPEYTFADGIALTAEWYFRNLNQ